MRYIWELLIQAKAQGIDPQQIVYLIPKQFSPYLEVNFENLNQAELPTEIEVNPYYRFNEIFKDYFHPENTEDVSIRQVLFDLILHYLADIDIYRGMTKREYQIQFVLKDIENGLFGVEAKDCLTCLTFTERKLVGNYLLQLYHMQEEIYLFEEAVKQWFNHATVYANTRESDKIFLYLAEKESVNLLKKIKLLSILFLPFKYELEIYWQYLFGIIAVDETMGIDQMVIY